jgi:NAD+ synthase (glutamine-hydrolysing)
MKVTLCQVNPTIGDLKGNLKIICDSILKGIAEQSNVVLLPELVTTGYPPKDLLYNDQIWESHNKLIESVEFFIKNQSVDITVIFGGLHRQTDTYGRKLNYNAAYIIDKEQTRIVHKRLLPSYNVFYENRHFVPGDKTYFPITIKVKDKTVLCDVLICEDIWNFKLLGDDYWMPQRYDHDPLSNLKGDGPIFVINASPFWVGKPLKMQTMLANIVKTLKRPMCWVNQVGAHDDLVFGGYSSVFFDEHGSDYKSIQFTQCNYFEEDYLTFNFDKYQNEKSSKDYYSIKESSVVPDIRISNRFLDPEDFEMYTIFSALKLCGTEYFRKNGFKQVVFGASGGIDSAVSGAIMAIGLGGNKCTAITMPSSYSSKGSISDSKLLADACNMNFIEYAISDIHSQFRQELLSSSKPEFTNSITDENLQPRIRMMLLMAYCNEYNALLISTGNKSEMSMGYCTIYGDMSGGYSLLSDVWKTDVYKLANFINKYYDNVIPSRSIHKAPSAELKPNQKDSDSLPQYDILDPLLQDIIMDMKLDKLVKKHGNKCDVLKVYNQYNKSEFKRKQAPLGAKINLRSFDSGRNIPISKHINFI